MISHHLLGLDKGRVRQKSLFGIIYISKTSEKQTRSANHSTATFKQINNLLFNQHVTITFTHTRQRADILTKNIGFAITTHKTQACILLLHVPDKELYARLSREVQAKDKPVSATNVCYEGT